MSDRLAEIGRRIETVRQLGAVVNAMQGIAGQRAQQARALLPAVRRYAETARTAIGQARLLAEPQAVWAGRREHIPRGGFILFGAEQGFAGAFPEQPLDAAASDMVDRHLLLIGARTAALAAERGLQIAWTTSMPSKADALPALATTILEALYDYIEEAGPVPIMMEYPVWGNGTGISMKRASLLPLDLEAFTAPEADLPPLINLKAADLLSDLTVEYVFAQICAAAVETFVAENEARLRTMATARSHIDRKGEALQLEERITRQDQITAEVVELSGGSRAARGRAR